MERWLPRKLTVLGLISILLLPTSDLTTSILLEMNQLISSIVIMTQQIKEKSENPGKHHDYYGDIDDDTKGNGLGGMRVLMGLMRISMLPSRLMRTIWMR